MKKLVYLHPFVFALYTVLFLFSKNIKEYRLEVLPTPIAIATVFTLIVYGVTFLIVRKVSQAAVIASAFAFICLTYSRFLEQGKILKIGALGPEIIVFASSISTFLLVVFLVFKKKGLLTINKALLVLSCILILFPLYDIISFEAKTKRIIRGEEDKGSVLKLNPVEYKGEKPDIYYIILDRYAGQKALQEQYNFDNSTFLDFLREKGFYIPSNSTTNYPKTFLSLASSLNMEYMDFLTEETNGGESADQSIVTPYMQNSKILEYLKNRGYKYIQVGSWWEPTAKNRNADINFTPPSKNGYLSSDEFTTGFLDTTIAAPLFKIIFHDPMDVSKAPDNNTHRKAAIYQFKVFKKIPEIPGPKFVFAHILLPHDPFVFDENCNPTDEEHVDKRQHQENYLNQLQCTNKKVESLINDIIEKSKTKPIIIIQADEGPFPMNVPIPNNEAWGSAETISLREKFPIFSSYYFPGKDISMLYSAITPVNSFRVLLDLYFGENLPLLPDVNYVFEDSNNYYKFIDVTDRVKK